VSKQTLGAFVRQRRESLGMKTIQALADEADLNRSQISELESGKETVSYDSLIRIAAALKVRPGTLLDVYAELPLEGANNPDIQRSIDLLSQLSPEGRKVADAVLNYFIRIENAAHNAAIEAKYDRQLEEEARLNMEARAEKEHDAQTINEVIHRKIVKSRNRQDKTSA
jgi:transcriptional regulator with XRE-family HTH domain